MADCIQLAADLTIFQLGIVRLEEHVYVQLLYRACYFARILGQRTVSASYMGLQVQTAANNSVSGSVCRKKCFALGEWMSLPASK